MCLTTLSADSYDSTTFSPWIRFEGAIPTMSRLTHLGTLFVVASTGAACTEVESATELHPEGPPMIQQVFTTERITDTGGASRTTPALAFGTHEQFLEEYPGDDGVVTTATVAAGQRFRIVVDELLIGNYLEEILCRDFTTYARVPEGATPDDIARCAVADDILPESCPPENPYSVCVVDGVPIGVLDENEDGAVDETRFIEGAVRIVCTPRDGGDEIDVPISLSASYWQPSGNQLIPAVGGYNAIGPAIIVQPAVGLPTNSDCRPVFDSQIQDKDHQQLCAPAGGDISRPCTPGDVTEVQWGTEVLRFLGSSPSDGATGIALTSPGSPNARILVQFTATVDDTFGTDAFVLLEGGTPRTDIMIARDTANQQNVTITVPGGYLATTEYTL